MYPLFGDKSCSLSFFFCQFRFTNCNCLQAFLKKLLRALINIYTRSFSAESKNPPWRWNLSSDSLLREVLSNHFLVIRRQVRPARYGRAQLLLPSAFHPFLFSWILMALALHDKWRNSLVERMVMSAQCADSGVYGPKIPIANSLGYL